MAGDFRSIIIDLSVPCGSVFSSNMERARAGLRSVNKKKEIKQRYDKLYASLVALKIDKDRKRFHARNSTKEYCGCQLCESPAELKDLVPCLYCAHRWFPTGVHVPCLLAFQQATDDEFKKVGFFRIYICCLVW